MTSCHNIRNGWLTSHLGSMKNLSILSKLNAMHCLVSAEREILPKANRSLLVEMRDKGVSTIDRTSVRCYHDGISDKGVPVAERKVDNHSCKWDTVCLQPKSISLMRSLRLDCRKFWIQFRHGSNSLTGNRWTFVSFHS